MQAGSHGADPWWQINRWLGIEAYLHLFASRSGSTGPALSVFAHALKRFNGVLSSNGLQAQPCRERGAGLTDAFRAWWEVVADTLCRCWQTEAWSGSAPVSVREVCGHLCRQLGQQPGSSLAHLTRLKNQRLWSCIQQLNQTASGPVPTEDGWLARIGGIVRDAALADDDVWLEAADVGSFIALRAWLTAAGLGASLPLLEAAFGHVLNLPPAELTVPNHALPALLSALNRLAHAIPTRGLPADWDARVYGPVPDLFAYPVVSPAGGSAIDFVSWARLLNTHYHIPPMNR
jgi:hypothetical protein